MADPAPYPGVPRWVKVSAILSAVVVLFVVVLILVDGSGRHGPGRHLPSADVTEPSEQQP